MYGWDVVREWIISGIVQNAVWVMVAIVFVQIVQSRLDKWWYGKWQVVITKKNKVLLQKPVSPAKVKQMQNVPEDKLVFLKGLIAPFEMLNCDLLEDGPDLGLYEENVKAKRFVINLDNNPPPSKQPKRAKL